MRNSTKFKFLNLLAFLCFIPSVLFAQNVIISGTVKDEAGVALVGANVVARDGDRVTGTSAGLDGAYTLSVSPNSIITFSYIGYNDLRQTLNNRTVIDAVLTTDAQSVEEVVVVGYGTQKKVTVTGAVTNLSGKELLRSPTPSLGNALSGKMPGVQTVQYSGRPGADDPQIFIRGVNSLSTGGSQPLVLVDGVERSFTQIDPNEVADISVLKDASATAVFGVRGANGVILITTKRGDKGKANIELTASYGIQSPTKFLSFADSYTYANVYNYTQKTDGTTDRRFSDEVIQHFKDQDMPLVYPSIDWMSYVMKSSTPQQQYNINISGGTDKIRYFTSVGVLNQDGLFKTFNTDPNTTFKYDRYNYRANIDMDLGKISTLSVNIGGRVEQTNDIGLGEEEMFRYMVYASPFSGAGIVDGKHIVANELYVGKTQGDALWRYYGQGYRRDTKNVLNLDLSYKLDLASVTEGLTFNIKGSYNSDYTHRKTRTSGQPQYKPVILEDGSVGLEKSGDAWPLAYDGESSWFGRNWYAEASFNYSRSFGDHNIGALLLYNQSKRYYPSQYTDIPSGYVGLVGRVTYNYATKYLLDLNAGYNGSENFAPGKRYGLFPSASIGWIASSEEFMQNQNVISYLKLRASYGLVGNDNNGNNRFLYLPGSYGIKDEGYNFGSTNKTYLKGAYESTSGNPDVSWETSVKMNVGLDLKVLDNRLTVNVDLFKEKRSDILISNANLIAAPSAQTQIYMNYGKVESHGYEVQLNWSDKIGNDFHYSITPAISFSRNQIIEMAEIPQNFPWLYRTNQKVGQPFGFTYFGLYEPGKTEAAYKEKYGAKMPQQRVDNSLLKRGDAIYVDLSGDGYIDDNDLSAIGNPDYPEYTYSLNAFFNYKGFDLSMTWAGAANCARNLGGVYLPQFGEQKTGPLVQWIADNSWREDNPGGKLPRISFSNETQNTAASELWYVDTRYIRLKNLEIGYTFDRLPLKMIKSARIYANGSNLLTFTPFKGNDPENKGGSYGNYIRYPMMKVFNFGIRASF